LVTIDLVAFVTRAKPWPLNCGFVGYPPLSGRLAVQPPELRESVMLSDGSCVTIRPILPTDNGIEQDFIARLSPRTRRYRFLC
jgi:hypothetical protein